MSRVGAGEPGYLEVAAVLAPPLPSAAATWFSIRLGTLTG